MTADPFAQTLEPTSADLPMAPMSFTLEDTALTSDRFLGVWTIERYARFCADQRIGDIEEVRAAYAIVDEQYERALVESMNRRLSTAPVARARWMALVAARLAEIGARGRA